jgi:hypothetical protein
MSGSLDDRAISMFRDATAEMKRHPMSLPRAVLVIAVTLAGCGHRYIKGTRVEDTKDNKQIFDVIEDVRGGLEERNAGRVMKHVSSTYFEDMGTPEQADDYGYDQLKLLLPQSLEATKEMHVVLDVHAVTVEDDHAFADIRYASRARIELPSGGTWDTHREFNRIEFVRENDQWMITSGL